MQQHLSYAVVGTGAVGGYYGGKLAQAGHDVHFLFHSDYQHVCLHGLQVNSPRGTFHLDAVKAYSSTTDMPPCDVVIVALKTVSQPLLQQLLPPLLKPTTLVLLIQNGIGVEAAVEQMLPGVQLAAGLAFICAAKNQPGVVDHLDLGKLNVASYNADAAVVQHVVADFIAADVEARSVDYLDARWQKALWNMPFNGLSVLLEATTSDLLAHPDSFQLLRNLMLEVVGAAQAVGCRRLNVASAENMLEMTRNMTPYSPSMKLDWEHRRPMEIEYIYSRAIAEAERAGAAMPLMRMLEQSLRFKEWQAQSGHSA